MQDVCIHIQIYIYTNTKQTPLTFSFAWMSVSRMNDVLNFVARSGIWMFGLLRGRVAGTELHICIMKLMAADVAIRFTILKHFSNHVITCSLYNVISQHSINMWLLSPEIWVLKDALVLQELGIVLPYPLLTIYIRFSSIPSKITNILKRLVANVVCKYLWNLQI